MQVVNREIVVAKALIAINVKKVSVDQLQCSSFSLIILFQTIINIIYYIITKTQLLYSGEGRIYMRVYIKNFTTKLIKVPKLVK